MILLLDVLKGYLSWRQSHFPRNRLDERLLLFQLGEWVGVVPYRLHPLLHQPGGSNSYAIAFGTAVGDRTRQLGVIGLNCTSLIRSSVVAKDRFHQVVKTALAKDGWNVTHDPLQIKVGSVDMEIDLGAERLLAAERGDEKIAVEVKSFLASASAISEFHTALGQFINYRAALRREDPDRVLYLAVPDLVYNSFFQLDFPASMLQENSVKIIVYNIELEQISQWKE